MTGHLARLIDFGVGRDARDGRTDKESDCLVDNSFAARDIDDDDDDANDANQLICARARDGEGRGEEPEGPIGR